MPNAYGNVFDDQDRGPITFDMNGCQPENHAKFTLTILVTRDRNTIGSGDSYFHCGPYNM